ncbi:MAG: TolC family protein, partial [Rhodospirillaceae bacterium]|nr:TolC family protein [Rhodospirillaceae bacterium]
MCRKSLFAVALAVTASVSSPAVLAAPLDEELRGLVDQHPLIKSGEAQVMSADKGVRATLAPFLPTIDITGGAGYEHVSTPTFRATPDGPFSDDATNYAATLRENIFDGGKKYAARRGAKLQRDVAGVSLMNTRQTQIFEGVAAYINVLRQSELVNLAGQNGDNIRKQLNLEDERVRRGSGIAVDVLQAKSRLQLSLERLSSSRGAFEDRGVRVERRGTDRQQECGRPARCERVDRGDDVVDGRTGEVDRAR